MQSHLPLTNRSALLTDTPFYFNLQLQSSSDDEKIDTDALEKKLREKALLSMKMKKAERDTSKDSKDRVSRGKGKEISEDGSSSD